MKGCFMIVIVHGPQGCGKSRHASALALHFGLNTIQEYWNPDRGFPPDGTLALTNYKQAAKRAGRHLGVVSISFKKALTLATRPCALLPKG